MMKKLFFCLGLTFALSHAAFSALPRTLYVVNGLAETLSKINLQTDSVTNHITTLGVAPNQVVVKGNRAYVVNSLSSNIQIIDLSADTTLGFISFGANRNPWAIAFLDSQIAFVTNFAANTLSKIDVMAEKV